MAFRDKLKKLESVSEELTEVLVLPDGTEVRYDHEEVLEAFLAAMDRREHRLLPYLRQTESREGLLGLIKALEASRERVEGEAGAE